MNKEAEIPVKAYTLLEFEKGKEPSNVAKNLKKIIYVTNVHLTYGVYDGIAFVEAPNMDSARESVTWGIRRDDGVRSTLTCIVVTDKDGKPIGFKRGKKPGEFEYIHPSLETEEKYEKICALKE